MADLQPREPRVLLVEDDASVRDAVSVALAREGYAVTALVDAERLQEVCAEAVPDVAILDIRLPGSVDGLEAARRLKRESDVPVVFLTAADALSDRVAGMGAGAAEYLVKPFSMAELLTCVKGLLRRAGQVVPTRHRYGLLDVDEVARNAWCGNRELALTRPEFELLVALVRQPGRVLSRLQLVSQLWGLGAIGADALDLQMTSLRDKLALVDGPDLVAIDGGFVLRDP